MVARRLPVDRFIHLLKSFLRRVVFPATIYLAFFCLFEFPALRQWAHGSFTDQGDGLQNLWNLWWVNQAIHLHQSPWHTFYLHFPFGTTLLGHTLNPFNGFMAVPLLTCMSLGRTYDTILILSFVFSGLTQFWLAWHVTRHWSASLLAGFLFTFSAYHCAHADGHLQLVAMEGVPLFLLCWIILLDKKTLRWTIAAAAALLLIILCDYYYFIYAIMAGCVFVLHAVLNEKIDKQTVQILLVFIMMTLVTSGVLAMKLLMAQHADPFLGSHDATVFSMDLLAPFVPGSHWRFAPLTQAVWSQWTGDPHETSVYLGWSVIGLVIYTFLKCKRSASVGVWGWLVGIFGVLALGPHLHIAGRTIHAIILPYALLQALFPFFKLSDCPVRMAMMVSLTVSILAAISIKNLDEHLVTGRWLFIVGVGFALFEYWPQPLPITSLTLPGYVQALAAAPSDGGVIDTVSSPTWMMYFATVHGKPMGLGYLSRLPTSVLQKDEALRQFYRNGEWNLLRKFGFRYIVMTPDQAAKTKNVSLRVLYRGADGVVERIGA